MSIEEMASQLRYDASAIERLNVPEYNWWNEGLHGIGRAGNATVFPQTIGLAATFDTDLAEKEYSAVKNSLIESGSFSSSTGSAPISRTGSL